MKHYGRNFKYLKRRFYSFLNLNLLNGIFLVYKSSGGFLKKEYFNIITLQFQVIAITLEKYSNIIWDFLKIYL